MWYNENGIIGHWSRVKQYIETVYSIEYQVYSEEKKRREIQEKIADNYRAEK